MALRGVLLLLTACSVSDAHEPRCPVPALPASDSCAPVFATASNKDFLISSNTMLGTDKSCISCYTRCEIFCYSATIDD